MISKGGRSIRHHLVVLHEHYLEAMAAGRKRVECRLSSVMRPPFQAAAPGDLLWFKLPSRPIRALAVVGRCVFRKLERESDLSTLLESYASEICADDAFYDGASNWARYASLIWIESLVLLREMPICKSDQRAWVVLDRVPMPRIRIENKARRATSPT